MSEQIQGGGVMEQTAEAIGSLVMVDGEAGYRVAGDCCLTPRETGQHKRLPRVYRVNIGIYTQHCCRCGRALVQGVTEVELFDGK